MGKKCALPGCNKTARKKFCSDNHKDKFHNRYSTAPSRKARRYLYDVENDFHPYDPYALGQ